MNTIILDMPKEVKLTLLTDYAKFCNGDPVKTLNETIAHGLCIRWNDAQIEFVAENGGVSFRLSGIEGFYIDRQRRMSGWHLVELGAKLMTGNLMILYADAKNEVVFDAFMETVKATAVPMCIEDSHKRGQKPA